MANKRIRLYGCPGCGSELTARERREAKADNTEGYTCRFCESKEPLAYLGTFDKKGLYE